MPDSDLTNSLVLADWAEKECRHLDLIASWEVLLSVYEVLGFAGPDRDDVRLEEFKTVITEVNKFLTRMKNGLARTNDIEDAIEFLSGHLNVEMGSVKSRPNIAFNKLKQRWIGMSILTLTAALEGNEDHEGESDD